MSIISKIFCDFDGVISNSTKRITELYNEDFKYYDKYSYIAPEDVRTWDFEECNCATKEQINSYFNQPRFFEELKLMPYAATVLKQLAENNDIIIVSAGDSPNLKLKEKYIREHFPFAEFIGVNINEYYDKSHIDMTDGFFIDDLCSNLISSNAKYKICFGRTEIWNEEWIGKGIWCVNWNEVDRYIYEMTAMKV